MVPPPPPHQRTSLLACNRASRRLTAHELCVRALCSLAAYSLPPGTSHHSSIHPQDSAHAIGPTKVPARSLYECTYICACYGPRAPCAAGLARAAMALTGRRQGWLLWICPRGSCIPLHLPESRESKTTGASRLRCRAEPAPYPRERFTKAATDPTAVLAKSSHALPPACSQPETKQDADAARCCMGKGLPAPSSEGVAVLVCACQDLLGPGHRQRYRATARPSACRGARRHAACRDLLRLVDLGRKEGRPAAVGVIENHEFAVDFGDVFLFR